MILPSRSGAILGGPLIAAFLIIFTAAAVFGDVTGLPGYRELDETLSLVALALAVVVGFVIYRIPVLLLALVPYPAEMLGAWTPEYDTTSLGKAIIWSWFFAAAIAAGMIIRLLFELVRSFLR